MKKLPVSKAFSLLEPGPVVLVTAHDGQQGNIMTISWTMVVDFTPVFALTAGQWSHSCSASRKSRERVITIPSVDPLDQVLCVGTTAGTARTSTSRFPPASEPQPASACRTQKSIVGRYLEFHTPPLVSKSATRQTPAPHTPPHVQPPQGVLHASAHPP